MALDDDRIVGRAQDVMLEKHRLELGLGRGVSQPRPGDLDLADRHRQIRGGDVFLQLRLLRLFDGQGLAGGEGLLAFVRLALLGEHGAGPVDDRLRPPDR